MKKMIRLTESDLHRLIAQVINEAVGQHDNNTQQSINNIRTSRGLMYEPQLGNKLDDDALFGHDRTANALEYISDGLKTAMAGVNRLPQSNYTRALRGHIINGRKLLGRIYNETLMGLGEQPDDNYNDDEMRVWKHDYLKQ